MIDINFVRKQKDKVRNELKKRNTRPTLVDELLEIDQERRELLMKVEQLKAKQNAFSDEIRTLTGPEKQGKIIEMKAVAARVKEREPKLLLIQKEYRKLMSLMPNISHPSVPIGVNEDANEVLETWGEIKDFGFTPKTHMEIGEDLDLIDTVRGVKLSGNRFYFLKNDLVRLELAVVQYLFDFLAKKGFTLFNVPVLVKEAALYGTGFFPAAENEIYKVNPDEDKLYLTGTSEVALAGFHANEVLDERDLPKKFAAFSTCFRREAGAYGKDTKGIIRVHQFDKVEMVKIATEENSWQEYDDLIKIFEEILQRLEIPYQKKVLCTGDISPQSAKTIDLEGYFPGQSKYRELGSGSNTTTFQARRLKISYRDRNKKKQFAHLMNCTAAAMPRLLVAILENNQLRDGSVMIPAILRPYLGSQKKIQKHAA